MLASTVGRPWIWASAASMSPSRVSCVRMIRSVCVLQREADEVGGIDSALVLAIAVDALGADKVRTVMMPSPYTADISWIDARDMATRMGVRYDEISIKPQFEAFKAALATEFAGLPEDTTEENLQARIRGTLLMALSNKFGAIVLTTGNKSEMSTGYCTLYGDMAGGFAVIKDVAKTRVFDLARWRNANDPYGTGANPTRG